MKNSGFQTIKYAAYTFDMNQTDKKSASPTKEMHLKTLNPCVFSSNN